MKTIIYYLPYFPLYLLTLAGLILIIKAFISALFPPKDKRIDLSIMLDQEENEQLYKMFSK